MTIFRIRGFTLVELVMVIMITGILAASITIFLVPAVNSYFDTRRRADLTDMADTALRRMAQDIRRAVPNSIRWVSGTCFQLVPTIGGGRYRMGPNTTANPTPPQYLDAASCSPSATCSAPLDTTQATKVFDVLSPMTRTPAQNDWIVIGNQNADDVYTGVTRGQISAMPQAPPDIRNTDGRLRIEIESGSGGSGRQFPSGYDGGRFVVVSNTEQAVFYSCDSTTRTLYRTVTDFDAVQGTSCGLTTGAGVAVVATDVERCTFVYNPNQGATQQSGFVWMRLELSRQGESITLAHGAHVDNVP